MRKMRAVSYPLAIVIIIAVTVAIAAGFVTWVTTLWYSRQEPEILQIYPDTTIKQDNEQWKLLLHVKNIGTGKAEIYKIILLGKETITNNYTIGPTEEVIIEIPLNKDYSQNTRYQMKIYLKSGNVYSMISWVVIT